MRFSRCRQLPGRSGCSRLQQAQVHCMLALNPHKCALHASPAVSGLCLSQEVKSAADKPKLTLCCPALQIPVNWSAVSPEAVYRWGLSIQPTWLSQAAQLDNTTVAVHLFGVEEGQCPPGTTR